MKVLKRTVLVATAVVAFAMASPGAQSKFTLKVHTGRGQIGYDVNSTMVIGEKNILIIDPQFSLSEAHRLAAELLESRKHPRRHLLHPPASGSSVRARGAEAGVSGCEDRRAAGDGECGERRAGQLARSSGWRRTAATSPGPDPVLPEELVRPNLLTVTGRGSTSRLPEACRARTVPATASSTFRHSRPS